MSHTPGPWRIHADRYIEASSEDDHVGPIAEIRSDLAYPYSDPRVSATRQANARLIAAAPELLKALEIVEPIIDDVTESVEPGRMIRAAIAKARGEE